MDCGFRVSAWDLFYDGESNISMNIGQILLYCQVDPFMSKIARNDQYFT